MNMEKKTIEPVGIPLAGFITAFSLDDRLIYAYPVLSWNGEYVIPVYALIRGLAWLPITGRRSRCRANTLL